MGNSFEIHFAPLQGYTDCEFRHLFDQFFGKIDAYYTPFIRLEEDGSCRRKDLRELRENHLTNLIPQIMPGSVDELKLLTEQVASLGFRQIDLNMGCPFPMIVRRKRGCGLLGDTQQASSILQALSLFPGITFSLKLRLGWASIDESYALLDAINSAPLAHIALHPRLGTQQYKGECDRTAFGTFARQCVHPMIYNGDIHTVKDAHAVLSLFPSLHGLMIGRGLITDPLLALRLKGAPMPSKQSLREFHNALFNAYASRLEGDAHLLAKMKPLWEYFLVDADKKSLKRIHKSASLRHYQEAVNEFFKNYEA